MFMTKLLIHRPRPSGDIPYYQELSTSFPSGHATVAMALYGFLIYIICKNISTQRKKLAVLFVGASIIVLIGLSRMYLGVHYFSDVLGGYLVGLIWVIISITTLEWRTPQHPSSPNSPYLPRQNKYAAILLAIFVVIFYIIYAFEYTAELIRP